MRAATLCLIILYPLTAQFSIAIGDPNPALFLLLVGVMLISTGLFRSQHYKSSAYCLFGAMGVYFTAYFIFSDQFTVLYIPPLLAALFLFWLFGRSLRAGRTPLISKLANAYHGELPPSLATYTRRLTMVWTGYFALFALGVFFMAFVSSTPDGSFYIHTFNYTAGAALLAGEYLLRIYRFKDIQHPSFMAFLRLLSDTRLYLPFQHR